jgi:hypothetical protein
MPKRLSMNIGFVTNSSFAVHHFPRQLLEHPDVRAFIEAFEISQGFIGSELWNRSACSTVAMTKEQKAQIVTQFKGEAGDDEWMRPPAIDVESDDVVIIYGDEYTSLAQQLSNLMGKAAEKMNLPISYDDYH